VPCRALRGQGLRQLQFQQQQVFRGLPCRNRIAAYMLQWRIRKLTFSFFIKFKGEEK
jgi:hypothetical protein